jgi:hypothetical protein
MSGAFMQVLKWFQNSVPLAPVVAAVLSDPGYCERYWKDYGNAMRSTNGSMTPRMFDDLPICVEAYKARKALINR